MEHPDLSAVKKIEWIEDQVVSRADSAFQKVSWQWQPSRSSEAPLNFQAEEKLQLLSEAVAGRQEHSLQVKLAQSVGYDSSLGQRSKSHQSVELPRRVESLHFDEGAACEVGKESRIQVVDEE